MEFNSTMAQMASFMVVANYRTLNVWLVTPTLIYNVSDFEQNQDLNSPVAYPPYAKV